MKRTVLLAVLLALPIAGLAQQGVPQYQPPTGGSDTVVVQDTDTVRVAARMASATTSTVHAPTRRLEFPDRFDTREECISALSSGQFGYYTPSFLTPIRLRSGERRIPLEQDACVRMQIVGRVAWVPQARGTNFDFRGEEAVRRSDCGNRVYAVAYPRVLSPTLGVTAPVPEIPRQDTYVYERPAPQPYVPVIRDRPWWQTWRGPAAGAAALIGGCAISGFVFDRWCVTVTQRVRVR